MCVFFYLKYIIFQLILFKNQSSIPSSLDFVVTNVYLVEAGQDLVKGNVFMSCIMEG